MRGSLSVRGFFFIILLFSIQVAAQSGDPHDAILSAERRFQFAEFGEGTFDEAIGGPSGLTMSTQATRAAYTSPPFEAPISFNALVPRWQATLPEGADVAHTLEFEFRTAKGDVWTPWLPLHASFDNWQAGDPMVAGDMLVVPAADVTHDRAQFRVVMTRQPGEEAPRLNSLTLTFIDSTAGPTTEELLAQLGAQPAPEEGDGGYPKPPVIPRSGPGGWCTEAECTYSEGLEYYPVSHLILHHTVTSSTGDSAATVRAIWRYHTFTNGWGDIGYNYLVDVNGVIFEGHLGGDDVVGTHAAGANRGSMAASLIGNFVDVTPPDAMLNAVADLFAWKADQKDIDIYDAGMLPDVDWGLPKLMGHRDVYGTTQCPGDRAHALLPTLREMIAQRINFTPDHLYFDELDPASNFTRSNATWNVGPRACGFNTHAYYAWSTTDPGQSQNSATWRPQVNVPGRYELYVYAPFCRTLARDTNGAVYHVTDRNGSSTVVVNQEANLGLWVSIGTYSFDGTSTSVSLSNLTSTDNDWGVWFDAIRLRYLNPGALNQVPEAGSWQRSRTINFQWSVTNDTAVTEQILQVSTEASFNQPLLSRSLGAGARSLTHTFSQDYLLLYWRVVLRTSSGQLIHSPATSFGLDTVPPTSSAYAVLRFPDGHLSVALRGEDEGSGISGYNIDYRAEGTSTWTRWLDNTQLTVIDFVPPQTGTTYWFRSQATDVSGYVEAPHAGNGDSNTAQALMMDNVLYFPLIN